MSGQSRTSTASAYLCVSLGIVRLHIGQGIDTVEVRGSSLLVPTHSFSHLQPTAFSAWGDGVAAADS